MSRGRPDTRRAGFDRRPRARTERTPTPTQAQAGRPQPSDIPPPALPGGCAPLSAPHRPRSPAVKPQGAGHPPPAELGAHPGPNARPGPSPRPPSPAANDSPGAGVGPAVTHREEEKEEEQRGAAGRGGGLSRGSHAAAAALAQRGRECAAGPAGKDAADPASWRRRSRRPGRAGQGRAGPGLAPRRRRRCGGWRRARRDRDPGGAESPANPATTGAGGGRRYRGVARRPARGRCLPPRRSCRGGARRCLTAPLPVCAGSGAT